MNVRHLRVIPLAAAVLIVLGLAVSPVLAQATPSPSPSPSGSSSPSPTPTPSRTQDPQPSPEPSSTPSDPEAAIDLDLEASELLGQVGDLVEYSVEVRVTEPVDKLVVTGSVPIEMDITAIPVDDEADAISSGKRGAYEDIVWVLRSLTPNDPVSLQWTGRVTDPGDLVAKATVQAKIGSESSSAEAETFLAAPPKVHLEGTTSPQVKGKIVRFVPVERSAAAPGSLIPVTGWSPTPFLWAALGLMALGFFLVSIAGWRSATRQAAVLLLVMVITAACTSSTPDQAAKDEPSDPAPTTEESPPAEVGKQPKDRVKGIQIRRDAVPTTVPTTGEEPVPTTEPGLVPTYRRVVVQVPGQEVSTQESRATENSLSFVWDESARAVTQATSSIMIVPGATSRMTVSLGGDADGLLARIALENTSDQPLHVDGTMTLEVWDGSELVATLTAEPIDVVLEPDGTAEATYRYLLPTGEYSLSGLFEH